MGPLACVRRGYAEKAVEAPARHRFVRRFQKCTVTLAANQSVGPSQRAEIGIASMFESIVRVCLPV